MDKNIERENLLNKHQEAFGHKAAIQSVVSSQRTSYISSNENQEMKKFDNDDIDIVEEEMKPQIRMSDNMDTGRFSTNVGSRPSESTPKAPRSPIQRVGTLLASPGRAVARQVQPGSVKASVFSLITICLGIGTITIPYIFYENGIFLGIFFILFGGGLSMFTGHLIGYCAYYSGGTSFEEVAFRLYGKQGLRFTSFCNIVCNVGFLLANCVLFKTTMPKALDGFHIKGMPDWLTNKEFGEKFWLTIFCFGILFWISLPRNLGALRFTSLASFGIALFIVTTIIILSFPKNPDSFGERLQTAIDHEEITVSGIFKSMPLIIFSYMYQPLIPAIYHELTNKSIKKMDQTLFMGTLIASVVYILCGIFGYVTFSKHKDVKRLMELQNILNCYDDDVIVIKICMIGVLTMVLFASPFCVLPSKDSFEQLLMPPGKQFTSRQNILCTLGIFIFCWGGSMVLESLGQVMTILGATTNSGIGFLIPIVFYLKVMDMQEKEERESEEFEKKQTKQFCGYRGMRWLCYAIFVFVCAQSIISLVAFVQDQINGG